MLTKTDFQTFEKLIDKRLDVKLNHVLDEKLKPIHDDIKIIKKDVRKLKKDVGGVIDMADKGLLAVQKRVKKVEKHLGFPEVDFV